MERSFSAGDRVRKASGDYRLVGTVVAAFASCAGKARYVVEADEPAGLLHIYSAASLEPLPPEPPPIEEGAAPEAVLILYRNWRGEVAWRSVVPSGVRWAATPWHREPGWILDGRDTQRDEVRSFAMKDILRWHVPGAPAPAEGGGAP
jgi:hypothetical protein